MSGQDFSLRPFAVGTVTGLRNFSVSPGHQLTGVVYPIPWIPGENNALCVRRLARHSGDEAEMPEGHRIAGLDCICGFYAYFGDSNDYAPGLVQLGPRVTGIVEAYGTVTIGSRGFRASKARIVAIVQPHDYWADMGAIIGNYPGVPVYATVTEALTAHSTTKPQDVGINPSDYPPPPPQRYAQGGFIPAVGSRVYVGSYAYVGHVHVAVAPVHPVRQTTQRLRDQLAKLAKSLNKHEAPATTPVERKRAASQLAAENRARAGLSNLGGINRRRRNP